MANKCAMNGCSLPGKIEMEDGKWFCTKEHGEAHYGLGDDPATVPKMESKNDKEDVTKDGNEITEEIKETVTTELKQATEVTLEAIEEETKKLMAAVARMKENAVVIQAVTNCPSCGAGLGITVHHIKEKEE